MPVPRTIYTIWLNENPQRPEIVEKCLASQQLPGYEHRLIGMDSPEWLQVQDESRYMRECAPTQRWTKASDYLRMWLLWKYGGIFLDADMEIIPGKNFDDMLNCRMWIPWEFNGFLGNSGMGSEPGHSFLRHYMDLIDQNFRGDGELVFQIGMTLFNDILYTADKAALGITIVGTDYFFPYNHMTGKTEITENTRVIHHYRKGWTMPSKVPI